MSVVPQLEVVTLEGAAATFDALRPRLFGIAYRLLGTVADAEDVVQDAWLRWQTTDRQAVRDATGFLVTVTTRLAINAGQAARVRRETYVGPWLPEPVDTTADPALGAVRDEALTFAVLTLMEHLAPVERAAYVLREAFDYPYARIAEIVERSEPTTRQLVTRARRRLAGEAKVPVRAEEHYRLLMAFIAAARAGDLSGLERVLTEDVVSLSDGNGERNAARVPIAGRTRIQRLVVAVARRFWDESTEFRSIMVNGQPALLVWQGGAPVNVLVLGVKEGRVDRLFWVMAPDKLRSFGPLGR